MGYWLPIETSKADENELIGAAKWNPLQRAVCGMHSLSPEINITLNAAGEIALQYNADGGAEGGEGGGLQTDFNSRISGNILQISGGGVYWPSEMASISGNTFNLTTADSGKMAYVRLTSKTAGQIVLESGITHTLQTGDDSLRVTLPLAIVRVDASGIWRLKKIHSGAFVFLYEPHFWISGFAKADEQSLDKAANGYGLKWTTYGDCEQ